MDSVLLEALVSCKRVKKQVTRRAGEDAARGFPRLVR